MARSVTTRSYDNARTGADISETVLAPDAVRTRGIRRLFSLPVPGDARGVEAQPLVAAAVPLADGSMHEVVYLADMANQVWAFDAGTGTQLWKRQLGTPVKGSRAIDAYLINDHWGVLSTPVIDEQESVLYAVAWSSPDGSVAKARHVCHALALADGSAVHPPLDLEGAVYRPGHGLPTQQFASAARKQRAALLLTDVAGVKTLFVGFGSVQETGQNARGWIIACSTSPFALSAAWTATARGQGGGIWHGAGGLAADDDGVVYAMTGNGTFDGVTDFSESVVKLRYTPPANGVRGQLRLVDWWTAFTDAQRTATTPGALEENKRPSPVDQEAETAAPEPTNRQAYRELGHVMNPGDWGDMDLASGGPVLVRAQDAVLVCGKDGVLYTVDASAMGKTAPADLKPPVRNYTSLKVPPIFFTYYWPGQSPQPPDIRQLNSFYDGETHHLHGNPLLWESPDLGPLVYCWGENGNLRAWAVQPTGALKYLACSGEKASPNSAPPGGMTGGMISVSGGPGMHSGVVWALIPYGDANKELTPGRLLAYDATQFGTFPDGSQRLEKLWDSQDWALEFTFNKFNRPVTCNGRLYVPTYDARVDVYGLA